MQEGISEKEGEGTSDLQIIDFNVIPHHFHDWYNRKQLSWKLFLDSLKRYRKLNNWFRKLKFPKKCLENGLMTVFFLQFWMLEIILFLIRFLDFKLKLIKLGVT